jgi:hypothetical protein
MDELADDLECVGLASAAAARAALGGFRQVLERAGLVAESVGDGHVDVNTACSWFLLDAPRPLFPLAPSIRAERPPGTTELLRHPATGATVCVSGSPRPPWAPTSPNTEPLVVAAVATDGTVLLDSGGSIRCVRDSDSAWDDFVTDAALAADALTEHPAPTPRFRRNQPGHLYCDSAGGEDRIVRLDQEGNTTNAAGHIDHVAVCDVPSAEGVLHLAPASDAATPWRVVGRSPQPTSEETGGVHVHTPRTVPLVRTMSRLLDEGLSSWSVKIVPGRLIHDRMLWSIPAEQAADSRRWNELLKGFGAPAALANLTPTSTVLVGYEADSDIDPMHKIYVTEPAGASTGSLDQVFGPLPNPDGTLVFDAIKWRAADSAIAWRCQYRLPAPGSGTAELLADAFSPEHWRWAHALVLLAAADTPRFGWSEAHYQRAALHTQNLLVVRDPRGRYSVDAQAAAVIDRGRAREVIRWIAAEAGLSRRHAEVLEVFARGPIERVAGGTAADGSPFLTMYRASTSEQSA